MLTDNPLASLSDQAEQTRLELSVCRDQLNEIQEQLGRIERDQHAVRETVTSIYFVVLALLATIILLPIGLWILQAYFLL